MKRNYKRRKMIRRIIFNKTYSVEPWFSTTNPRAKVKKYKLNEYDRGYNKGKRYDEYIYIPLFKKGLCIDFKENINIIVGANGCGKSQLLSILNSKLLNQQCPFELEADVDFDKTELMGFDFESDALKNLVKPNPENNATFLQDTAIVLDSQNKSHGENSKMLLDFYQDKNKNVLFMDEPENGLDLPSQIKLIKKIKELAKNNQLFIITHNKIIIEAFEEIYDLDRKKWTTPDELFSFYKLK
jgi:predicted ATPase